MPNKIFIIINFIWFQTIWVVAIVWQNQWVGLLGLLLIAHLAMTPNKLAELGLWLVGGLLGIILDSTLTRLGFFIFSPPPSLLPIPLWLVVIWFAFLGTLRHSLAYVTAKLPLAIALGALVAPISYFAGMRLGAVAFGKETLLTVAVLSCAWATLMPTLVLINRWFHPLDKYRRETKSPTLGNTAR